MPCKSLKFYASKSLKPSRLDKSTGQDRRSAHLPATKGEETKPLRSGANYGAAQILPHRLVICRQNFSQTRRKMQALILSREMLNPHAIAGPWPSNEILKFQPINAALICTTARSEDAPLRWNFAFTSMHRSRTARRAKMRKFKIWPKSDRQTRSATAKFHRKFN